jgi:hypothetical protein
MARNFTETIKAQVRDRANGLCEYCHAGEKWQFVQFTIWSNDKLKLLGTTPTGRATVKALDCNRDRLISIRIADIAVNRHPPIDDPIE